MLNKKNGLNKKEILRVLAVQVLVCSVVAMAGVAILSSLKMIIS